MKLPVPFHEAIVQRFGGEPSAIKPVAGGSHAEIARCTANRLHLLVKWSRRRPSSPLLLDPCTAEARGLQLLVDARALRVPAVYFSFTDQINDLSCIVMEWINTAAAGDQHGAAALLGNQLATLHRQTAPAYGLDHHNYCGASPQWNDWHTSWVAFYRDQRLVPQLEQAAAQGRTPSSRRDRLERLMARLDQWLSDDEPPSLLHGDLWSGNWLVDSAEQPVLIDPAVYYGHREIELAMSRLFGGFPASFFAAYDEAWPPLPGRDDRIPLYQLYHWLNHLNLYGESYGAPVDRILQRYAS